MDWFELVLGAVRYMPRPVPPNHGRCWCAKILARDLSAAVSPTIWRKNTWKSLRRGWHAKILDSIKAGYEARSTPIYWLSRHGRLSKQPLRNFHVDFVLLFVFMCFLSSFHHFSFVFSFFLPFSTYMSTFLNTCCMFFMYI